MKIIKECIQNININSWANGRTGRRRAKEMNISKTIKTDEAIKLIAKENYILSDEEIKIIIDKAELEPFNKQDIEYQRTLENDRDYDFWSCMVNKGIEYMKILEVEERKDFYNGHFKEEIKAKKEAIRDEIKSQFDNLLFYKQR